MRPVRKIGVPRRANQRDLPQERGVDLDTWSDTDWQKGLHLYARYDRDVGVRDIVAILHAAKEMEGASGRVGVMGFCLGGLMTFLTAARHHPDAAVAYHGGDTEKYLSEARGISAPLLMHLAEEDEFINKDAQARSPMVKAPAFAFGRWGCALRIDASILP